ncbi:DAK2 domain-containing protein [Rubrobacter indicoceani]|uniref:DAK2 domain-containing protein n=1 Tax=Rubrobacter indicoceani TaxID=2051957 RepID=UPI0013C3EA1C|nr:DAK2 domain-containing protein [Rubrobacter indicoceani]
MTIRMAFIVAAAHAALKAQAARINALNVYPVPDGDTGTNMLLTLESILKEAKARSYENVEAAVKAGARAALMGARGNSGVILSQMIRGGCEVLARRSTFTAEDFAAALEGAQERAYASTRQPVEGTMLTVIKDAATAAREALAVKGHDLQSVVKASALEAHASVKRTPQKLAVLKEAGVVDAGGLGVAVILDGIHAVISGEKIETSEEEEPLEKSVVGPDLDAIHAGEEAWGYCTEFIVTGFTGDAQAFEDHVEEVGQSVLVISDDDLVKVHLHTQDPGAIMSYAGRFGRLTGIKVDDMEAQVGSRLDRPGSKAAGEIPTGTVAVVAASRGSGNRRLFEEMGALVIEGGQGANPSAQDFAEAVGEAVRRSGAEGVVLLPNNKNVIATAEQVAQLVAVEVSVVPTKTLVAGLSVMVAFDASETAGDVTEEMNEVLAELQTVEVTRAVRDATVDGREVAKGSFMALLDGNLASVGKSVEAVAVEAAGVMISSGADLVTLLCGEELDKGELEEIVARIESLDGDVEVEIRDGGQPLYPLQMAAE